ncbi:MAG TPA: hypothetical protein VJ873_00125, partial [bacterium]|nr:hypothetical protein [bacterium]
VGLALAGLLVGFSWVKTLIEEKEKGFSKLFGWASGALLTALMMLPLFLHPHYSSHTSDISVFSKYYAKTPAEGWAQLRYNISFSVGLMYGHENDVAQCPLLGDCIFDFWVAACGLLGLSYFVSGYVRFLSGLLLSVYRGKGIPKFGNEMWTWWVSALVILLYGVALVPFVLSHGPHSFRLMAVYLPLFLATAWGVSRLWLALLQTGRRFGGILFALFLLVFMGWEIDRNEWLLTKWLAHLEPNALVGDQAYKELPDHRVYLVNYQPGFFTCGEDILCDGKDIFQMNDTNAIGLLPEEKGKDLAILVYGPDTADQKKIEEAFPGLTWQKRFIFWQGPTESPYLWWTEIPFDKIPQGDKGLFHVERVSPWTWERRCYGQYGLGRGFIIYNDRVVHWNDNLPPPNKIDWNNSMRVEGQWNVKTGGDYSLAIRTNNVIWVLLDGKKVLEVVPGGGGDRTTKVHLESGPHRVELVTAFTSEHRVPTVYVIPPDGAEIPLDDLAAASAPLTQETAH